MLLSLSISKLQVFQELATRNKAKYIFLNISQYQSIHKENMPQGAAASSAWNLE